MGKHCRQILGFSLCSVRDKNGKMRNESWKAQQNVHKVDESGDGDLVGLINMFRIHPVLKLEDNIINPMRPHDEIHAYMPGLGPR